METDSTLRESQLQNSKHKEHPVQTLNINGKLENSAENAMGNWRDDLKADKKKKKKNNKTNEKDLR